MKIVIVVRLESRKMVVKLTHVRDISTEGNPCLLLRSESA